MGNNRGKSPSALTKWLLIARTAGRCQICNKFLLTDRQLPPFKCPKGFAVILGAKVTTATGNHYSYVNDGDPIPKESSIEFRVGFGKIRRPFTVKWQVVNTGQEALRVGQGRGEFTDEATNSTTHIETTLYKGSHSIQCFIMKAGKCVAKSNIFIVNVQ